EQSATLWQTRIDDAPVSAGFVSLQLGAAGNLDSSVFLGGEVWLSLTVDDVPQGGRQLLASVPSAAMAHAVQLGAVQDCDVARAGALRFTDRGEFEGCNGSSWVPLGAQPGSEVFPGRTCL